MRLVEFALDFPNIKKDEEYISSLMKETGCDRDEALNKFWNEIGCWKRREFENQTKCITSFFARVLKYVNTKDCWKILIECVDDVSKNPIKNLLGVYAIEIPFDYDSFMLLDGLSKKKLTLETLMKGIKMVAADKNWDMEPFERTYAAIIQAEYKNEWIWRKPVKSPSKKHTAKVFLKHEVNEIEFSIIIEDKKGGEIFRKIILSELPNEWNYAEHLGELKWLDDRNVTLINKKKDKEWLVNLPLE